MAGWRDGFWWSEDSLRLHYRDYADGEHHARPPILCLPGLTRNVRDFEGIAEALTPNWRVICAELRGRGESAYDKNPLNYVPLIYLRDIEALVTQLGLGRFVLFGTSLGGLLAILLGASGAGRLAGVLLNDIGPVIEEEGLARIRTYVGKGGSWPTWLHAARAIAEVQGVAYPDYDIEDWLRMAKRLCRLTPAGRVVLDYDARLAEPFRQVQGAAPSTDLWPTLDSLRDVPGLIVRGGLSDVLSPAIAEEMARRLPRAELVTLPRVGHAPSLDEPEARRAINRLLTRVAA